ncbi:haloacid dehalogenase type II [uncultured Clostridium sp.]|uniref:haloacid dehalogenase type II n=1 Tax=uncultured Clostridium sp. TaxID=59620 RepID=UPI00262E3012|nr:haloacid dehalogenase type II [uncultured Clostridium sp.]
MEKLKNIKICVFDAYGTLFDVHSASLKFKDSIGANYEAFSNLWREKQLEYSFLREIMNNYTDFLNVTKDALNYACNTFNISNDTLKNNLINSYMELSAYTEVKQTLSTLKNNGIKLAILTNGSYSMINKAVISSGLNTLLDDVISVEELQIFKPNQKVYNMVLNKFNVSINEVAFFSSNGWDIMGATKFGFRTFWVNRLNKPVEESEFKPFSILHSLSDIIE